VARELFEIRMPQGQLVALKSDEGGRVTATNSFMTYSNYWNVSDWNPLFFRLHFLESVAAISAKLKAPVTADRKFEDVVKSARDAAVLVLVY
jgi:hypothetical protein